MSARGPALGRAPARLVVPALVGVVFLMLPLVALLSRTPWVDFLQRLTEPAILDALRLSLVTSLAAIALVCVVGVPLAVATAWWAGSSATRWA
jgi:molybdate transport system permease protein